MLGFSSMLNHRYKVFLENIFDGVIGVSRYGLIRTVV